LIQDPKQKPNNSNPCTSWYSKTGWLKIEPKIQIDSNRPYPIWNFLQSCFILHDKHNGSNIGRSEVDLNRKSTYPNWTSLRCPLTKKMIKLRVEPIDTPNQIKRLIFQIYALARIKVRNWSGLSQQDLVLRTRMFGATQGQIKALLEPIGKLRVLGSISCSLLVCFLRFATMFCLFYPMSLCCRFLFNCIAKFLFML